MAHEYRHLAKTRLAKAAELLAANDDDNLVYACLELRRCVEALAYDLLTAYLHEVPLSAFETWQPDKVMKELLQVDPRADTNARISFQKEATGSEPAGPWKELGEDRRIKAPRLAKMFHQLGNALHVPTIRQVQAGQSLDYARMRQRAEQIRDELGYVLAAKIWNAHLSISVTVSCTECETPIKRATSYLNTVHQIECGGCGQAFLITRNGDDYFFEPVHYNWHCDGCGIEREIVESNAKPGLDVSCPKCRTSAILALETQWSVKQTPSAGLPRSCSDEAP
ncbi:MAG: hypothetical protein WC670_09950 [Pseudolabrys sp.]|jgi:hypothetical protein